MSPPDKDVKRARRQAREQAGRRAETLALWYLRAKGYKILARRFKTYHGEIDIIAQRKKTLAIIEVKQRQSLAAAEISITPKARKRIGRATKEYIARNPHAQKLAIRYDAIFLIGRFRIFHKADLWRDY